MQRLPPSGLLARPPPRPTHLPQPAARALVCEALVLADEGCRASKVGAVAVAAPVEPPLFGEGAAGPAGAVRQVVFKGVGGEAGLVIGYVGPEGRGGVLVGFREGFGVGCVRVFCRCYVVAARSARARTRTRRRGAGAWLYLWEKICRRVPPRR